MTILVQCSYDVPLDHQDEFERIGAERRWPELLDQGVPMVAYGHWTFGGRLDSVTVNLGYADFVHLARTHPDGQPALDLPDDALPLVRGASMRVIELSDGVGGVEVPPRQEGTPPVELPPSFGRGSVISERTYVVGADQQAEFLRLSHDLLWPWLEHYGARMVGFGHDPFGASEQLITLFAFPSLADWYRLSRPEPELSPPPEMIDGWQQRSKLIQRHWGRLLTVVTDFGRRV